MCGVVRNIMVLYRERGIQVRLRCNLGKKAALPTSHTWRFSLDIILFWGWHSVFQFCPCVCGVCASAARVCVWADHKNKCQPEVLWAVAGGPYARQVFVLRSLVPKNTPVYPPDSWRRRLAITPIRVRAIRKSKSRNSRTTAKVSYWSRWQNHSLTRCVSVRLCS